MTAEAELFRKQLRAIGLSDPAIEAAWPEWWSDAADPSPSARLELRFSVARKLGIDPLSITDETGEPRFIWRNARFKNLSGETETEKAAISSFGRALAILLRPAVTIPRLMRGVQAIELRSAILNTKSYVGLSDLLALCWGVGIPVVHLRLFPGTRKRMAAMSVQVADQAFILLAKDSMYPAQIAFYVAHEIAHIALGHLFADSAIVDMESEDFPGASADNEEEEADRFALELLTGRQDPRVLPATASYNAPALADAALHSGRELHIEPGTLALCFGYATRNWAVVNSAMKFIYSDPKPVWNEINRLAMHQLTLTDIAADSQPYVQAVLGQRASHESGG
jgi:hypothetical protein